MNAISMRKVVLNIILPILLLFGGVGNAAQAPAVLYSWSTARGLERWAEIIEANGGVFTLKTITMSIFSIAYPQYEGAPGVFAWSNPATGMGNISERTTNEWYAKEDKRTGDPARLAVITLKENMPVTTLDTYVDYSKDLPHILKVDPRGAHLTPRDGNGLIFHRIINANTGEVVIQEYIILKRGFIAAVAADPRDTYHILEEAKNSLRSSQEFSKDELHSPEKNGKDGFNSERIRKLAVRKIERTQLVPSENIPAFFRSLSCEVVF